MAGSSKDQPIKTGSGKNLNGRQGKIHEGSTESVISKEKPLNQAPLSFAQERLWFMDRLQPNDHIYNIVRVFRIKGRLDTPLLEKSFSEIVRRQESLRTTFEDSHGQPVQKVIQATPFVLKKVQLEGVSESEKEKRVQFAAREESRLPFDLTTGPLLRATLIRLDAEDHVLIIVKHHIITDGWSMGLFFRELSTLYEAFSQRKISPLPGLPILYTDFALWQRSWLVGKKLVTLLNYWKRQLNGVEILRLPADRPRPPVQSFRGKHEYFHFPKPFTDKLTALTRKENATLFMTLLTVFQTLMYRYTGQEDIAVGVPIANRNRSELEGIIGFFVNTLVLRTDLSGGPSFRELLGRVREVALEAYAHQELPFEKLVAELKPDRSQSHTPLFQVMFVMQNASEGGLELPGLSINPVLTDTGTSKFDITLIITRETDGLHGRIEYSTDLFDAGTIQRMTGHYRTLLEGIVSHPDRCLSKLPMLTEAERHQLLSLWNTRGSEYPVNICVHELFEQQVEQTPGSVAVAILDRALTYRELNSRANQVARFLKNRQVGPDVLVGIFMERSLEMIVGVMGVLKAGGAYLPMDPSYPKERLAFMLKDTQVSQVLTQKQLAGQLQGFHAHEICMDTDWDSISLCHEHNPGNHVSSHNLFNTIYTSGSTGKPKGVMIEHRSVVALLHWASKLFSKEDLKGVLASTSLCFDLSVFEIFFPLSQGGRVLLAENALQLSTMQTKHEITLINTVPSAIASLLKSSEIPASVRTVNLAGEPLKTDLVDDIYRQSKAQRVFDLYGPSEDTVYSTYTLRKAGQPATIGVPIDNTRAYILDDCLQPVPIGIPGELYLGGDGLARGYLNRPELTAQMFILSPFDDSPGSRLYKTGDLVRYFPDGNIQFLGRLDHQVKIRGFRIELGEIENALSKHPDVHETVVTVREDQPGDKRLVAYVVTEADGPTPQVLRQFLDSKLPGPMIPSAVVRLNNMPMTPNGKIDRKGLPAPEREHLTIPDTFVSPRTDLEKAIAEIWSELLKLKAISIHDNFFDLGGHSLLAIQFTSRIHDFLEIELPVRSIFDAPTLAGISEKIQEILIGQLEAMSEEEALKTLNASK